ncbi:LytR/AlgR family response regulator transcription factor [Zhaonella formicivorans]|uniref:LytR/AlgR family response regulator transcription factor n=1 Tax=Zhaonella formicivorans TaxID=2528593 RepID=UPI0010E880D0|nr:LytTR family DNA-binding domain-containing protein [Zhaonella formicivorans]
MPAKVVIVDDEIPAREELRYLLEQASTWKILGEADNGQEAVELIKELQPDVVFLDIHLQDMNGFSVAQQILEGPKMPLIVFATAYDEYAVKAFEVNAVDYLLKPFTIERVKKTVERVDSVLKAGTGKPGKEKFTLNLEKMLQELNFRKSKINTKLTVWENDRLLVLNPKDIIFAFTDGKAVVLRTATKDYVSDFTLQELEDRLAEYGFLRVHRGYLINLDMIKEILPWFHNTYKVVMRDKEETEIPVGRTHLKELREILNF